MKLWALGVGAVMMTSLAIAGSAIKWPSSKDQQTAISVYSGGKMVLKFVVLLPSAIEVDGEESGYRAGGAGTALEPVWFVKNGYVEIKPDKGKPVKISGELIYLHGYGKPEAKK